MGVCLGKSTDSSETRGSVPIADRPSVHCVLVIAGSLELIELEGSVKERFQTSIALAQDVFRSVNILPYSVPTHRRAKKRWSDSSLQVEDLKASGTPTSLAVACATFPSSSTIAVAHFIMHHDMSRKRIDALRLGCCSEPQP